MEVRRWKRPCFGQASRRTFLAGTTGAAVIGERIGRCVDSVDHHADEGLVAFFVISDTHYLASKDDPGRLEASSADRTDRLIQTLNGLAGSEIPGSAGGGTVQTPRCVIHAGDVIDSGDKVGRLQESMQRTEMDAFEKTMGLNGADGTLRAPIYEVHGNHDGPAGRGHAIDRILARNRIRPGVTHVSPNGLHYSWDIGDVHFVNLGIVVGSAAGIRRRRRYAPMESLDFLTVDLEDRVGASGRPVVITHHVDIARYTTPVPDDAPFADKEWDPADVAAFHAALDGVNVAAVFHGHTHGRSVWRWDGMSAVPGLERLYETDADAVPMATYDVFNCDNSAAPHGDQQAFFYVEISPCGLIVREYATKDAWATGFWSPLVWRRPATAVAAS